VRLQIILEKIYGILFLVSVFGFALIEYPRWTGEC
jgi:hypothetical protein